MQHMLCWSMLFFLFVCLFLFVLVYAVFFLFCFFFVLVYAVFSSSVGLHAQSKPLGSVNVSLATNL